MDLAKGREPLGVVPLEEEVDALVGVEAEELAYDDLDGEDLRVRELGRRAALAVAPLATLEPVVDEAEDGDDEGAKRSTGEGLLYVGRFGRYRA